MALGLLSYQPVTSNLRVEGFEIGSDETASRSTQQLGLAGSSMDDLIQAAYRQIFHEQQMIQAHRLPALESLLRVGSLSVREFIRGLVLSDSFRRLNFEPNSNYRFIRLCTQRLLGREPYGDREVFAWSTVLATQGLEAFVDGLLNSEEYQTAFGDECVPYQRRRILPQRTQGDLPFERVPRYEAEFRKQLERMGYFSHGPRPAIVSGGVGGVRWAWQRAPYPPALYTLGKVITWGGAAVVGGGLIATAMAAFGWISL
jgi:phycobilisome rod-core linker protein